MPKLDYYFSMVSPWAFIGHDTFMDIVKRHNVDVTYHPMKLLEVFENTGGLPPAKRHESRNNYRMLELQRWREKRGLDFDLTPAKWPYPFQMADHVAIAIQEAGKDPSSYMRAGFHASWKEGRDMADEAVLADVLTATGHDAAAILAAAKTDKVADIYTENTKICCENGYFGAPAYVLNGEFFWGQDRLVLLDDALASNRAPFAVPA